MNSGKDIRTHTMTLFWSSRSPFVRKVMVVAHEAGVADRIAIRRVNVSMLKPDAEVVAVNAIGRIPVLLTPDQGWLPDSRVACEYLDALGGGPRLFPAGPARWRALAWQADGDGLMETLVAWRSERERPAGARFEAMIDAYRAKFARVANVLEGRAEALAAAPFCIGHVAIGCALAYADFRFEAEQWRGHRPGLAAWHVTFSRRASAVSTAFADEY